MEKMFNYRFRINIPNSDAACYLVRYEALTCEIVVSAYCLEDAYNIIDGIFLSSPFDVHPIRIT